MMDADECLLRAYEACDDDEIERLLATRDDVPAGSIQSIVRGEEMRRSTGRPGRAAAKIREALARGADPNATTAHGTNAAIVIAARMDDVEAVILLANSGADVNAADEHGRSVVWHVVTNATLNHNATLNPNAALNHTAALNHNRSGRRIDNIPDARPTLMPRLHGKSGHIRE